MRLNSQHSGLCDMLPSYNMYCMSMGHMCLSCHITSHELSDKVGPDYRDASTRQSDAHKLTERQVLAARRPTQRRERVGSPVFPSLVSLWAPDCRVEGSRESGATYTLAITTYMKCQVASF